MSKPLDIDELRHGPLVNGLCWECDSEYGAAPIRDALCYVNALVTELQKARAVISDIEYICQSYELEQGYDPACFPFDIKAALRK